MDGGKVADGNGRVVVVTGATGRQGGAVARRLLGDGWRVRGVTRDATSGKAKALQAAGVEVVEGDMADAAAMAAAVAGAHGVFSVQDSVAAGFEGELQQGRTVAEAAAAAGVQHVVYGSAGVGHPTGVESWDAKLQVARHARELGLPLTVLRPMAFMELMSDTSFYPSASTWYVMPKLVGWDTRLPWISVRDLAVVVAAAFASPERFVGLDMPVAADVRSLGECRQLWREVHGRPPRRFPMPAWLLERFVGDDIPRMWRWLRTNPVEVDVQQTLDVHPRAMTVADFAAWTAAGGAARPR